MYSADGLGATFNNYDRLFNKHRRDKFDIGKFRFQVHSHDTGLSVQVWIIKDSLEVRHIISTDYWFYSRYCFNDSKWEKGAWDDALNKVLAQMKEDVNQEEERLSGLAEMQEERRKAEDAKKKQEAEALFQ